MYNVLKEINDSTILVEENNQVYIAKVIELDEVPMYRKLMSIRNPNVIEFYKTEVINNKFCIVEEYLQGETLEKYVTSRNPLSDKEIKNIVTQICGGLAEIHRCGIVHRDINPSNVMVCKGGAVKLIDFGISRSIKPNKAKDTQILGTPGYASPEQFGFSQTGVRSDIYSLGVLINFLKTKSLPNETQAGGRIGKIVAKCTRIDENERYKNINELMRDVNKLERGNIPAPALPGFRKKVWWHISAATAYYIFSCLMLYAGIDMAANKTALIMNVSAVVFMLFAPVFIITDFLDWTKKIPVIKNMTESQKTAVKIIQALLSVIVGCIIVCYSPE